MTDDKTLAYFFIAISSTAAATITTKMAIRFASTHHFPFYLLSSKEFSFTPPVHYYFLSFLYITDKHSIVCFHKNNINESLSVHCCYWRSVREPPPVLFVQPVRPHHGMTRQYVRRPNRPRELRNDHYRGRIVNF